MTEEEGFELIHWGAAVLGSAVSDALLGSHLDDHTFRLRTYELAVQLRGLRDALAAFESPPGGGGSSRSEEPTTQNTRHHHNDEVQGTEAGGAP